MLAFQRIACGREIGDYETIQTVYLQNYKNIFLNYITKLTTF
jgi:hypothetical protein